MMDENIRTFGKHISHTSSYEPPAISCLDDSGLAMGGFIWVYLRDTFAPMKLVQGIPEVYLLTLSPSLAAFRQSQNRRCFLPVRSLAVLRWLGL